jgi:hypothetical protein
VSSGDFILRGAALLVWLGSCARPTEVELRLFPCGLAGMLPVAVDLDVQGYDAAGVALTPLRASFAVAASVLDDGYATVGLRRPPGISTADFTLTWRDATGGAQLVMHPALVVPKLGEVLELGAEMCAPVGSTSSGSSSSGDATSTSTSSSSGTSTSTSSGTSSGTSSSSGTSTSGSTSTGATTESSTTGELSIVGSSCDMVNEQFYCENGGAGQLGTLLECENLVWVEADLVKRCDLDAYCPASLGLIGPVAVGCSGLGLSGWSCVCQDSVPVPCLGDEAKCTGNVNLTLCIDDGQGMAIRTKGVCISCLDEDIEGPWCEP